MRGRSPGGRGIWGDVMWGYLTGTQGWNAESLEMDKNDQLEGINSNVASGQGQGTEINRLPDARVSCLSMVGAPCPRSLSSRGVVPWGNTY